MSYSLHVTGHTDSPETEAEFLKATRRFVAHLRKVPGLGLEQALLAGNGDGGPMGSLLADRGTADAPVKPDGPTLPEGWSSHPDGGYVDAEGKRVAARDSGGNVTGGVDEAAGLGLGLPTEADVQEIGAGDVATVESITRADTPDLDDGPPGPPNPPPPPHPKPVG